MSAQSRASSAELDASEIAPANERTSIREIAEWYVSATSKANGVYDAVDAELKRRVSAFAGWQALRGDHFCRSVAAACVRVRDVQRDGARAAAPDERIYLALPARTSLVAWVSDTLDDCE